MLVRIETSQTRRNTIEMFASVIQHSHICTHILLETGVLRDLNPLKPNFVIWLHFECSAPYRPNLPFLISDIRALRRSGLSARVPKCQKLKMVVTSVWQSVTN